MILAAQRGEYVGKLIVLSLDESEKIIYDKIMKIVGESDICVDKTLLKEQEPMRIGELYIQSEQHKVLKRDQEVRLTNIEFRILYVLALHQGSILSKEQIYNFVWNGEDVYKRQEEHQVTVDGVTRKLEEPFFVIATQNPVETAGTFPLPEAQLDRFLMRLSVGLPSDEEEYAILQRFIRADPLEELGAVCSGGDVLTLRRRCPNIHVHPELLRYMQRLSAETRRNNTVSSGVSPRGTLALLRCSQALALVRGRDYVCLLYTSRCV